MTSGAPRAFAVTWDYRCPFARNAHEALVAGLREGRPWQVRFMAFSLDQVHLDETEVAIWDRPPGARGSGALALQWGIAVRDAFPGHFFDFHMATFAARFDQALRIDREDVVVAIADGVGLDGAAVGREVASGRPLATLASEHTEAVRRYEVFGVPTFIEGDEAVFVRFAERGRLDDLDRFLELTGWHRLNEVKRTRLPG